MNDPDIAEQLVEALVLPDDNPVEGLVRRPVHTIGTGVAGYFQASPVARDYCTAEHFQGKQLDVTVRFSNGSGSAIERDGWSDVRGMATRFHLSDGGATDLVAMTLPEFFAPTPETFLEFAKEAKPAPCERLSPWRKIVDFLKLTIPMPDPYPGQDVRPNEGAIRFADQNKFAQLAVLQAATIGAPVSYERASYHAVHTFIVTAPDGTQRWVRFTWQPIAGVQNTTPKDPIVDTYLKEKLEECLDKGGARFSLMMMIGELGDDFNDSTRAWPPHRKRVMMGTLTLDKKIEGADGDLEKISFNPCNLTDGIRASDDPVLKIRREAYEYSSKRRDATPCPFSGS
ncbi:catalase [Aliisedimentitalea scapharcae]|uniref:catalase n=1 Tax=Aliisedimentitalea scapharcae TaxID=1524259 RepID=A0ABZ2XS94_9RHOB|nr:catalase [Rhodobacteraceae bacterium M382]